MTHLTFIGVKHVDKANNDASVEVFPPGEEGQKQALEYVHEWLDHVLDATDGEYPVTAPDAVTLYNERAGGNALSLVDLPVVGLPDPGTVTSFIDMCETLDKAISTVGVMPNNVRAAWHAWRKGLLDMGGAITKDVLVTEPGTPHLTRQHSIPHDVVASALKKANATLNHVPPRWIAVPGPLPNAFFRVHEGSGLYDPKSPADQQMLLMIRRDGSWALFDGTMSTTEAAAKEPASSTAPRSTWADPFADLDDTYGRYGGGYGSYGGYGGGYGHRDYSDYDYGGRGYRTYTPKPAVGSSDELMRQVVTDTAKGAAASTAAPTKHDAAKAADESDEEIW